MSDNTILYCSIFIFSIYREMLICWIIVPFSCHKTLILVLKLFYRLYKTANYSKCKSTFVCEWKEIPSHTGKKYEKWVDTTISHKKIKTSSPSALEQASSILLQIRLLQLQTYFLLKINKLLIWALGVPTMLWILTADSQKLSFQPFSIFWSGKFPRRAGSLQLACLAKLSR